MTPYWLALLLLSPLPVMLAVAMYAWPQRTQIGPRLLLALMLTGSLMTVAYAGDIFAPTLEAKLIWLALWYGSALLIAPLLLLLAIWNTDRSDWLAPRRIMLLIAPVLLLFLYFLTNQWHHQFYLSFGLDTSGPLPIRTSVHGSLYWLMYVVVLTYYFSMIYLLARAWRRLPTPYNIQSAILLIASLAPVVAGLLHIIGINAFGYINLTSLSLIVTGLAYAWGIARHQMFDLATAAHRVILQNMPNGIVMVDDRDHIMEINPAACAMFGVTQRQVIGRPRCDMSGAWLVCGETGAGAMGERAHEITVRTDGIARQLLVTTESLLAPARPDPTRTVAPGQQIILLQDVTAYREAERKSREQQRQLVILEERERMGRDLHDGVGQVLGYVNAQLQAAREYLRSGQTQMADALLAQLTGVTQDAHADIRNFILGAEPGAAAPVELGAALMHFVERFDKQYGQQVTVTFAGRNSAPWLTATAQTQLLYVVQEALTNVRKHAHTAAACINCRIDEDVVEVTVADDGQGFDLLAVAGDHFGLQIMRARMEEAGGSVDVKSAPGRGTQVFVRLVRPSDAASPADVLTGLRVLLADDQPLFRDGLRNLLAARGIEVVGAAANGATAVELALELQPDVVIMDIHMPVLDGLAATEQIKLAQPRVKVLVLTVAERDKTLVDALRRGASGYLLKNLDAQTLFTMLEQLQRGETVLAPSMATHLVQQFAGRDADASLTVRQREILNLMAHGFTYREIATRVHLSESAVKRT